MQKNIVIFLISLNIIILSIHQMIIIEKDNFHNASLQEELKNNVEDNTTFVNSDTYLVSPPDEEDNIYWEFVKEDFLNVNFDELLSKNDETVGWIKMGNTPIDYPLVQTSDNEYYLTHSFDKTKNKAGWVFSDFRNNLDYLNANTIIYGHRRVDMSMFGSLINILDSSYINDTENQLIKISTPHTNMLWQVVSVYSIPKESYYITTHFDSEQDYETFLNTILERSIFDFKTKLNTDDKILTLSTCQDNFGMRIVLHARLIKKETNN